MVLVEPDLPAVEEDVRLDDLPERETEFGCGEDDKFAALRVVLRVLGPEAFALVAAVAVTAAARSSGS